MLHLLLYRDHVMFSRKYRREIKITKSWCLPDIERTYQTALLFTIKQRRGLVIKLSQILTQHENLPRSFTLVSASRNCVVLSSI